VAEGSDGDGKSGSIIEEYPSRGCSIENSDRISAKAVAEAKRRREECKRSAAILD